MGGGAALQRDHPALPALLGRSAVAASSQPFPVVHKPSRSEPPSHLVDTPPRSTCRSSPNFLLSPFTRSNISATSPPTLAIAMGTQSDQVRAYLPKDIASKRQEEELSDDLTGWTTDGDGSKDEEGCVLAEMSNQEESEATGITVEPELDATDGVSFSQRVKCGLKLGLPSRTDFFGLVRQGVRRAVDQFDHLAASDGRNLSEALNDMTSARLHLKEGALKVEQELWQSRDAKLQQDAHRDGLMVNPSKILYHGLSLNIMGWDVIERVQKVGRACLYGLSPHMLLSERVSQACGFGFFNKIDMVDTTPALFQRAQCGHDPIGTLHSAQSQASIDDKLASMAWSCIKQRKLIGVHGLDQISRFRAALQARRFELIPIPIEFEVAVKQLNHARQVMPTEFVVYAIRSLAIGMQDQWTFVLPLRHPCAMTIRLSLNDRVQEDARVALYHAISPEPDRFRPEHVGAWSSIFDRHSEFELTKPDEFARWVSRRAMQERERNELMTQSELLSSSMAKTEKLVNKASALRGQTHLHAVRTAMARIAALHPDLLASDLQLVDGTGHAWAGLRHAAINELSAQADAGEEVTEEQSNELNAALKARQHYSGQWHALIDNESPAEADERRQVTREKVNARHAFERRRAAEIRSVREEDRLPGQSEWLEVRRIRQKKKLQSTKKSEKRATLAQAEKESKAFAALGRGDGEVTKAEASEMVEPGNKRRKTWADKRARKALRNEKTLEEGGAAAQEVLDKKKRLSESAQRSKRKKIANTLRLLEIEASIAKGGQDSVPSEDVAWYEKETKRRDVREGVKIARAKAESALP